MFLEDIQRTKLTRQTLLCRTRPQEVNSKNMFEGTIMPAFYRDSGYNRILKKFDGTTILSAQEVEDLLAYVMTLKE